jgi:hypothetical protein
MVFPVLSKKRAAELRKIEAEKHKNDVPDGILK